MFLPQPRSRQTPAHPVLIAVVVSLAAFMEVLDTTITNVSLAHIAGSLSASQNESTWVLTSYLVANGIVLPLSGWLAEVMGRKRFFMACIAGFTLASFACGISSSLSMLITFRLLQGVAGGGLQPMQQAIVMDAFPIEKRGVAFAITGVTIVVAPILGPTLGGWVTDNYSWRWIFFMNIPIGVLALVLTNMLVEDPPHAEKKEKGKVDFIGLGLLALGLGALQIVLDKGQDDDWFSSSFIVTFTVLAILGMAGGVYWLLRQKDPMVDLRLLKDRRFGWSCVMVFFIGAVLYGSTTLIPLLVQTQFGYDATLAGLVLSPSGIVVIFMMALVGKLVNVFQARYLVAFGMAFTAFGMYATSQFTPQTSFPVFVIMRILQMAALPFLFVPIGTLAFSRIPMEKNSKASALFNLMRNLGGSFGISLILTYLIRRSQLHQSDLASNLSASDAIVQQSLGAATRALIDAGQLNAMTLAFGQMYRHLVNQAVILAYSDAFHIFVLITGGLAIAAFLLPRNDPREKSVESIAGH